ncbi:hypothetical protein L596_029595 [Steinernema carpocapsae]|uniref:Uncharacterized protein n=1 Tax=Steinernema carpocapsae TaxID=34508 RepID=A0A4U5LV40_STECR|nr:hypothetical protein L596_029595 [Steinernema carpocapsae]
MARTLRLLPLVAFTALFLGPQISSAASIESPRSQQLEKKNSEVFRVLRVVPETADQLFALKRLHQNATALKVSRFNVFP